MGDLTAKEKIILASIILVIAGTIVYKKVLKKPLAKSSIVAVSPIQNPVNAPEKTETAVSTSPTVAAPSPGPTETALVEKTGLCGRAPLDGSTYLIPYSVFKKLNTKNSKYFALPSFHGECFADKRSVKFKIVSYDKSADRPYAYWGDFETTFTSVQRARSLEDLTFIPEFKKDKLGFKTKVGAIESLVYLGGRLTDSYILFKISEIKNLRPRQSSGTYDFYPGVQVITKADYDRISASSEYQVLDVRFFRPPTEPLTGSLYMRFLAFKNKNIIRPTEALQIYDGIKKLIPPIPKEKKIILVGASGKDMTPYNVVQVMWSAGYKNISVLYDGYTAIQNKTLITPVSYSDLKIESLETFRYDLNSALILDTRPPRHHKINLPQGWTAPIYIPEAQAPLISDPATREKIDISKINLADIKAQAANKKIILIGSNDYDWSPLVLFDHLKKNSFQNLWWVREGFDGIDVYSRVMPAFSEMYKMVRPARDTLTGGEAKKAKIKGARTLKPKTGTVIQRQRRKFTPSRKTFRVPTKKSKNQLDPRTGR